MSDESEKRRVWNIGDPIVVRMLGQDVVTTVLDRRVVCRGRVEYRVEVPKNAASRFNLSDQEIKYVDRNRNSWWSYPICNAPPLNEHE